MNNSNAREESQTAALALPEALAPPDPKENKEDSRESPAELVPTNPRHSRKCQICRHPDREDIEQDYRDWLQPSRIARQHNVHPKALYRHLRATGLAGRRRENLRIVLDRIIERGVEKPLTGDMIIRAVRAHCCLTEDNRWEEPERRVIYIREDQPTVNQSQGDETQTEVPSAH